MGDARARAVGSRALPNEETTLMAPSRTFPSVITASRWGTAWQAAFSAALKKRGRTTNADGTLTPRVTNGEALDLIWAFHQAGIAAFPLYAQYAAVCYGWSADSDIMDVRPEQRDALMSIEDTAAMWLALFDAAGNLDNEQPPQQPRLRLDQDSFDNSIVQGAIASQLQNDGAGPITFRIKGDKVAPVPTTQKPKPKPQPKIPLWIQLTLVYVGYRVIKNITGGPRYAGD